MIRKICLYGDPILSQKCETVAEIGAEEKIILDDMWDTMQANNCIGLSAPQIGVSKRLFVVNVGGISIRGANPEVISEGAMSEDTEGSPCIPSIHKTIRRPSKITCRYLAENGTINECVLKGIAARAFLHEADHHEGKLFIDHLKPIQRKLIQKDLDKIAASRMQ